MSVIISCEHAGNEVPEKYKSLFEGHSEKLNSHEGWDPAAYDVAKFLSDITRVPFFSQPITRLLVEMNRSVDSKQLFSSITKSLSKSEKESILNAYYYPYRKSIEQKIISLPKPVMHLSIHSFTPVFKGEQRTTELGILFDPERLEEVSFAGMLREEITKDIPYLKVHDNEPYKGTDDGLTTYLRTQFGNNAYAGIELEINQKFVGTKSLKILETSLLRIVQKVATK